MHWMHPVKELGIKVTPIMKSAHSCMGQTQQTKQTTTITCSVCLTGLVRSC